MGEARGTIACFATYRPPVPLDIYSCPNRPSSTTDELHITDGISYNYNCHMIPSDALQTIIQRPKLATQIKPSDVDLSSGMVFVSERDNLETLYIALRFNDSQATVKVFSFADVYGTFDGVRLEDNGCIAGGYKVDNQTIDFSLVYVSTQDEAKERRQPWTAVFKTNLRTAETKRLTPKGVSDLSPSISPSRKKIALASFQGKGWKGEIEDLQTDIYVMNVEGEPIQDGEDLCYERHKIIENGGWPTWGSDNVIFFHRKDGKYWRVFRAEIKIEKNVPVVLTNPTPVTPEVINAVTPAAISATKVAVATFPGDNGPYRHIEIFDITSPENPIPITNKRQVDHFNPFVIDGGNRIGYHRCTSDFHKDGYVIERHFHKLKSPNKDVGLVRVSGVFPTISSDGSKLAFVDNEFKAVWVADKDGLRSVFETKGPDNIFSTVWNQNPEEDTLYVCRGPSFKADMPLEIFAIPRVSEGLRQSLQLTKGSFNNAFPSTNPEGTKLVFRSTRDGGDKKHKNLYIMENAAEGEYGNGTLTRLTNGPWTDTHCQWSPKGDWIVFSSTRDKPKGAPETDNSLDPGYFAVFLVRASDPSVVVRVIKSGDDLAGHVNHPFFSPDGKSITVTADLAGVTTDPIALPIFIHSVRPYGDIFMVDLDTDDIWKNKDVEKFKRITHSRYEYSTPCWTMLSTDDLNEKWNKLVEGSKKCEPALSYAHSFCNIGKKPS